MPEPHKSKGGLALASCSFWTPISLPPSRPKFGRNPIHSGSVPRDVTGSGAKAAAFFRDQVSEPLCVCHEPLSAAQVGSRCFFSPYADPWSGHALGNPGDKLIRAIQCEINLLENISLMFSSQAADRGFFVHLTQLPVVFQWTADLIFTTSVLTLFLYSVSDWMQYRCFNISIWLVAAVTVWTRGVLHGLSMS